MHDIHGGNARQLAREQGIEPEQVLDLSSNTFMACAPLTASIVATEMATHAYPFATYPDPETMRLRTALAAHHSTSPDTLLAGNGSAELIWLCLAALRPRKVIMLGPMFSEYARACTVLGIPWTVLTPPAAQGFALGEREWRELARTQADMAVICLPNNPAGLWYEPPARLMRALGARLIVADVTYRDFLYGTPGFAQTAHAELEAACASGAQLVSLHSLTKFFCCPGIRLGYAQAAPEVLARLRRMQPPWMVATFAEHIAEALLRQCEAYRQHLPLLREQGVAMATALTDTGAFSPERVLVGPSFITAELNPARYDVPAQRAQAVAAALAAHHVAVRVCDTIPGMPPGFIRMQIRPLDRLEPLLQGLCSVAGGQTQSL